MMIFTNPNLAKTLPFHNQCYRIRISELLTVRCMLKETQEQNSFRTPENNDPLPNASNI
jgi:hypothetical protein